MIFIVYFPLNRDTVSQTLYYTKIRMIEVVDSKYYLLALDIVGMTLL